MDHLPITFVILPLVFGAPVAAAHPVPLAIPGVTVSLAGLYFLNGPHNYVKLKYYRALNGFIAITSDLQPYLVTQGVAPEQVHLIPNFSRFKPISASVFEEHQALRFISFGRMVEEKGFAVLLQAFAQLLTTGVHARLLLDDDGPKRTALEHLAVEEHRRCGFILWLEVSCSGRFLYCLR